MFLGGFNINNWIELTKILVDLHRRKVSGSIEIHDVSTEYLKISIRK